jgi:hypothetical protein
MAITYNWIVERMDSYPEKDGLTDVVFTVYWRINANEGNYNATSYGSIGVSLDPAEPFTPYADLTESQVVGWVQSAMGPELVADIEAGLAGQIAALINPPVVTLPNPWSE